jgi:probable F420-dependent oxidoreductase
MGVNPKFWVTAAQEAERAGFESVWLPEHLVLPVQMSGSPVTGHATPPIPPSMPAYDVFIALGLIAATTSTIRLGTDVYNIGLRHPFVTARAITTLDVFSNGRVEFGIGASWLEEEWDATGLDFATRGARVDESIEICRRLWFEEVVEHHGEFFDFAAVMFEPKPVQQPSPPILVGGDTPAALRRAARHGDGWIPMNHTIEQLPASILRVNELRAAAGRAGPTSVTVGGRVDNTGDLARYRDIGVDRVICAPFSSSREAIDGIRRFGDDVIARFAS